MDVGASLAQAWPSLEDFVQQPVGQLPWGQNLVLLTKLKTRERRLAYAGAAVAHGWVARDAYLAHRTEYGRAHGEGAPQLRAHAPQAALGTGFGIHALFNAVPSALLALGVVLP